MFCSTRAPVWFAIGLCAVAMTGTSPSRAAVINFDGRSHGEIVTAYYQLTNGVTITAASFQGGANLPIAFDTARTQTNDPDLEDPWDIGNLGATHMAGKILIVAENDVDANGDGLIDRPDDQGSIPSLGSSGQLMVEFPSPQQAFGLDLIDVEPGDIEVGFIAFHLGGREIARVDFDEFTDPSSRLYDPTIVFGDNSANRIQPLTAAALNIVAFDEVAIGTGMCLGIDNLNVQPVPEPSALAAIALLASMLARRSRVRDR